MLRKTWNGVTYLSWLYCIYTITRGLGEFGLDIVAYRKLRKARK